MVKVECKDNKLIFSDGGNRLELGENCYIKLICNDEKLVDGEGDKLLVDSRLLLHI